MTRRRDSETCVQSWMWLAALALLSTPLHAATPEEAKALLKKLDVQRGICLVLGAPDPSLPVELAKASELLLYVQCEDSKEAAAARKAADEAGLLGTRVYVAEGKFSRLHLAGRMADGLVFSKAGAALDNVDKEGREEMHRVLRYRGATAISSQDPKDWWSTIAPSEGHDDWTHPYHAPDNNPQSDDTARGPYLTKFLAEPYYGPMPEVTLVAGGRIFKAFGHISFKEREWPLLNKLQCFNAYNGTKLWERDLQPGFMVHRNTMAAQGDIGYFLLVGDNKSCKVIQAESGKLLYEITVDKNIAAGPCWKWLALSDAKVWRPMYFFALLGEEEPLDETLRGTSKTAGWPWSGLGKMYDPKSPYRWGFGRTMVAIAYNGLPSPLGNHKVHWHHTEKDAIDGRAVAMNDDHIFYYSPGKFVAALDRETGKVAWKTSDEKTLAAIGKDNPAQNPRLGFSSTCYMKCSEDAVYFAGPQRDSLVALSAKDGKLLWHVPQGNYQLVLRKEGLFAMGRTDTCKLFEPLTGKQLADFPVYRGNCTRATGAADCIFARGGSMAPDINTGHTGTLRLDLTGEKPEPTRIPLMRPACQDGVIIANGQLYWGPWMCDCNLQLVGIISLAPAGKFDFEQKATEKDRLVTKRTNSDDMAAFEVTPADWPTYRGDNLRQATSSATVAAAPRKTWEYTSKSKAAPSAPITAGGLAFLSGADGVVRAVDAASGSPRWTFYTSGPIKYPPAVWQGRLFVGSCDGWIYALEAATGEELWRFRAAPIERVIPVYGTLSSTWPVAGGVLVEDGVVYAAAGIASYDGTHVYALDAKTGRIRWQNNTSGRLIDKAGRVTGISVQGHLLLWEGKLYMAGGNVVSPAIYDAATGKCLNDNVNEWQKGPRGRELFLVDGQVRVFDQLLYSPADYQPGRYFSQGFFVQAGRSESASGHTLVRGAQDRVVRLDSDKSAPGKPAAMWQAGDLVDVAALAVTKNAVLAAGRSTTAKDSFQLAAYALGDGKPLWKQALAAPPASWCLAVDRDGRVLVGLRDGKVLCLQ